MNRLHRIKARGVAARDQVCAPAGVTGESCVVGG